jgi:predicted nucleic acid-binding protein
MNVSAFFDADVLVYAAAGAGKDAPKRKRAMELVESTDFGTSAQVLKEFFVTVAPHFRYASLAGSAPTASSFR